MSINLAHLYPEETARLFNIISKFVPVRGIEHIEYISLPHHMLYTAAKNFIEMAPLLVPFIEYIEIFPTPGSQALCIKPIGKDLLIVAAVTGHDIGLGLFGRDLYSLLTEYLGYLPMLKTFRDYVLRELQNEPAALWFAYTLSPDKRLLKIGVAGFVHNKFPYVFRELAKYGSEMSIPFMQAITREAIPEPLRLWLYKTYISALGLIHVPEDYVRSVEDVMRKVLL